MKWRNVSISLMGVTLLVITAAIAQHIFTAPFRHSSFDGVIKGTNLQFGYYDILSKNREIYDVHFALKDKTIMMTMRNPNDNRMIIKIRMQKKRTTSQGVLYDYKPVYISSSDNNLMITNILGYMERNSVLLDRVDLQGENLVVTSFGRVISNF